jgi:hypothetical protein
MAKPNYAFEKRQKELAKKQKKQEKLLQRSASVSHEADPEPAREAGLDDAVAPVPTAASD